MNKDEKTINSFQKVWDFARKAVQKNPSILPGNVTPETFDATQIDNLLSQALYVYLAQNSVLPPIQNKQEAMELGYKRNPDVYAIVDRLTNMYAAVPYKMETAGKDGMWSKYFDSKIQDIIDKPNNWQVGMEFENMMYMFFLTMGDGIVYAPKSELANSLGQLLPSGMNVMPSQYVWIYAGSWMKPVNEYVINFNQGVQYKIPASDIIHMRMANPEFKNANNFYGISPIIVASDIVQMQLSAYAMAKATYERGFPAGILSKKDTSGEGNATAQIEGMEAVWRRKFGQGVKSTGQPVFTMGELQWTQLGFSSLQDLDLLNFLEMGFRKLCNLWGISSNLLNDPGGAKYNNVNEARKMAYTNRIIPDKNMFAQKTTMHLWKNYYTDKRIRVVPDWSQVPELQEDRGKLATTYSVGVNIGAYSRNEFREKLGDAPVDDPSMDERTVTGTAVTLDSIIMGEVPEPNEKEKDLLPGKKKTE
jgi:HK97 family phage portal protein